jgi:hypothetical protein
MAYDNLQHMLAVGTKYGYVKLYGGESVEYTIFHGGNGNSGSNSANQSFGSCHTTNASSLVNDTNNNYSNSGTQQAAVQNPSSNNIFSFF